MMVNNPWIMGNISNLANGMIFHLEMVISGEVPLLMVILIGKVVISPWM